MQNNTFLYDSSSSLEQNYDRIDRNRSIYPRSLHQDSSNEHQAYLVRKTLLAKAIKSVSTLTSIYDTEEKFVRSHSTTDNYYNDILPQKVYYHNKLVNVERQLRELFAEEFSKNTGHQPEESMEILHQ